MHHVDGGEVLWEFFHIFGGKMNPAIVTADMVTDRATFGNTLGAHSHEAIRASRMATSEQSRYAISFSGAEFVIANLTLESTMNTCRFIFR